MITPDGIVGKVRDVLSAHTAQLLLLNDASSGAGVVLASSRIRGILRGTASGQVQINNLTSDSRIKVGDQVVSSGGDGIFPRGLPVGEIQSIVIDPAASAVHLITIKPFANLSRLEEVLVITGTDSKLPASCPARRSSGRSGSRSHQTCCRPRRGKTSQLAAEHGSSKPCRC